MPLGKQLGKQGIRQKLGLTKREGTGEPVRASKLGDRLVGMHAKGTIAAGDVGEAASAASELMHGTAASSSSEGLGLQRLAKAKPKTLRTRAGGKAKPDTHNSSRALHRVLVKDSPLGPTYDADIVSWDHEADRQSATKMSFYPSTRYWKWSCHEDKRMSGVSFNERQQGFKLNLGDCGRLVGVGGSNLGSFVAIGLCDDSTVFTKRDSLYLLLFTVLSGPYRQRYWICGFNKRVLRQCGCHGRCTFDSIFQVIAWMFRALLAKAYPAVDHNGRPLNPGSRRSQFAGTPLRVGGACIAKCGDWQWFKSVLGLTGWRGRPWHSEDVLDLPRGIHRGPQLLRLHQWCSMAGHDGHHARLLGIHNRWRALHQRDLGSARLPTLHSAPRLDAYFVLGHLAVSVGQLSWELFQSLGGTFRNSPHGLQPTREHGENVQTHSERGLPNPLADSHHVQGRHTAGPQVQGQGGGGQEYFSRSWWRCCRSAWTCRRPTSSSASTARAPSFDATKRWTPGSQTSHRNGWRRSRANILSCTANSGPPAPTTRNGGSTRSTTFSSTWPKVPSPTLGTSGTTVTKRKLEWQPSTPQRATWPICPCI